MSTCVFRALPPMAVALQRGRIACAAKTSVKACEMVDRTLDATVSNIMATTVQRRSQDFLGGNI